MRKLKQNSVTPMGRMIRIAFMAGLFLPTLVAAAPVRSQHVEAELLLEGTTFTPGQTRPVLLRLSMDPGWHTYWQNPGDAGEATSIEWSLPAQITAGHLRWPVPARIAAPPLMSYGYEGETVLISELRVAPRAESGLREVRARARWLECADTCLPGRGEWTFQIRVAAPGSTASGPHSSENADFAARLERARARLPVSAAAAGPILRAGETLRIPVRETGWFDSYYFFESSGELIEHGAAQAIEQIGGSPHLVVRLNPNAPPVETVRGVLVRETLFGVPVATEFESALAAAVVAEPDTRATPVAGQGALSLWSAILFSFLGGLILNLMPCVFPVLSLKVFSFMRHANAGARSRWLSALAYTGGIVLSFWVLAATLLALRSSGQALGWGFQLQSPVFVFFLCVALFLFALNLLGVFEFNVSVTGLAAGAEQNHGYAGSFFSGVLAVVVATPCTAPFMGAALGFALTQSQAVSLAVFTFLGLGLAAPFLALASFPALGRLLPRPGDWMLTVKQVMGFLMLATVLWLVWVYGRLTDADGVALLLAGFLATALGAWILGRWNVPARSSRTRWVARAFAFVLLLLAGTGGTLRDELAAGRSETGPGPDRTGRARAAAATDSTVRGEEIDAVLARVREAYAQQPGRPNWTEYSPELVEALRGRGVPIFIDFTADWCLSCKVNERVALRSTRIWEEMRAGGIVALKADWTDENAIISEALAAYGRSGVPLYVVYNRQGEASFLPEVLTEQIVLSAVRAAAQ